MVTYRSGDGECIRSKVELRGYLALKGLTGSAADHLVRKAQFSQKFARRFILLNGGEGQDADTSRDELIARAMQASFDRDLGLDSNEDDEDGENDDGEDPDYAESSGSDSVGDVAAGGWRRRQSDLEQETAEDYDISCLEVKKLESRAEGSCPVCQSEWEEGDEVRILPCEHQFHTKCIDQWLKKHRANCPLCKKDVREDWEDEEEQVWDPLTGTWV